MSRFAEAFQATAMVGELIRAHQAQDVDLQLKQGQVGMQQLAMQMSQLQLKRATMENKEFSDNAPIRQTLMQQEVGKGSAQIDSMRAQQDLIGAQTDATQQSTQQSQQMMPFEIAKTQAQTRQTQANASMTEEQAKLFPEMSATQLALSKSQLQSNDIDNQTKQIQQKVMTDLQSDNSVLRNNMPELLKQMALTATGNAALAEQYGKINAPSALTHVLSSINQMGEMQNQKRALTAHQDQMSQQVQTQRMKMIADLGKSPAGIGGLLAYAESQGDSELVSVAQSMKDNYSDNGLEMVARLAQKGDPASMKAAAMRLASDFKMTLKQTPTFTDNPNAPIKYETDVTPLIPMVKDVLERYSKRKAGATTQPSAAVPASGTSTPAASTTYKTTVGGKAVELPMKEGVPVVNSLEELNSLPPNTRFYDARMQKFFRTKG